ncbi:MAG: OmpA family protein [Bacteroidota bacterium]
MKQTIHNTIRNFSAIALTMLLLSGCASYHMRQGNRLSDLLAYKEAIKEYEKALDSKYKADAVRGLASSNLKVNNIEQARQYYSQLVNDTSAKPTVAERVQYADLLMRAGKYDEAKAELGKITSLDTRGRIMLSSCDSIGAWKRDSLKYVVYRNGLNSGGESNFSPVYYKDGLLFVTDRGKQSSRNFYEWTGRPFLDIYYSKVEKDGKIASTEKLAGDVNGIYHEGPVAINTQGDTLYLTRNNYVKKKVGKSEQDMVNVKIYQLYKKDTIWTGLKELPFNGSDFSTGHPALTGDGNSMYFASDRPGGLGGSDIYVVRKNAGAWGQPVNLGPGINTPGNEVFPYVWKDSALYFSSDGLQGMGGLDLFKSILVDTIVGVPVNLGYPLNSNYDDFGIIINKENTEGYFSSNREASNTEIDQIYRLQLKDIRFTLAGVAVNKNTQSPVQGVIVELKNRSNGLKETAISGPDGTFKFKLDPRTDYSVMGSKDGYFTNSEDVTTVGRDQSEDLFVKLKLELEEIVVNKPIVLENIYYDLDKSDIRPDAKPGLDKLVQIMKDNPDIKIELGSHTDSRARDAYNDDLSQRRAESAVKYIVSTGIDRKRITAKGYGERQLVNGCTNGVKCTEEQHQANRRTEFKVVGFMK